ncbi:MAG: filamentous hemagglutinin N-terminal domain-containing protein, partial [Novosphingobium sp.]
MTAAATPQGSFGRRTALQLSTALASSLLVVGGATAVRADPGATELPVPVGNNPLVTTAPDVGPYTRDMPRTQTVTLPTSTVIDWQSFNIGVNALVAFNSVVPTTPVTALNRVTAGPLSELYGQLTSQNNVAVWLINPSGITMGPQGTFSGGSLVLSTLDTDLDLDPVAFLLTGPTTPFTLAGTSAAPITLMAGSTIASTGTALAPGSVIIAAQQVDASGAISAETGATLVAAQSVSFPSGIGSPLTFNITAGTALAGVKVLGTATITGGSVALAALSQTGMVASLLNVDPDATLTATADNGAVVLATSDTGSITFANGMGASIVNGDSIAMAGRLAATGAGGDVIVAADGGVMLSGTASLQPSVTARGAVDIRARTGTIASAGTVTVRADSDDTSTGDFLLLDAAMGTVSLSADTLLATGTAGTSTAGIGLIVDPAASVTLGDFDTAAIGNATRTMTGATIDPALSVGGDLTFDAGTVRSSAFVANVGAGATGGDARFASLAADAVTLDVNGDLTGPVGASTGTSDAGFGRAAITTDTGAIGVTVEGLAQLGTVSSAGALSVAAGDATHGGAIDALSATAADDLVLTARAAAPVDTLRDGDIRIGSGSAGDDILLSNAAGT